MNPSLLAFYKAFLKKYSIPFEIVYNSENPGNNTDLLVAGVLLVRIHHGENYSDETGSMMIPGEVGLKGYLLQLHELKYKTLEILYNCRWLTPAATKYINKSISRLDSHIKLRVVGECQLS